METESGPCLLPTHLEPAQFRVIVEAFHCLAALGEAPGSVSKGWCVASARGAVCVVRLGRWSPPTPSSATLTRVLPAPADGRRIEVIANGLPVWGCAQLAVDTILLSASARPSKLCRMKSAASAPQQPPVSMVEATAAGLRREKLGVRALFGTPGNAQGGVRAVLRRAPMELLALGSAPLPRVCCTCP